MAYVPKTLVLGRCIRCGVKAYKGELFYKCDKCGALVCPTCHRKVQGKCPACGAELRLM